MARKGEEPARNDVPLVRIFLSSPGDVAEERTLARQLIDAELPKLPSLRSRLALQLIAWDDPAAQIPMVATATPQDSVNAARPRPATCDIVIVILWSRMGTPLPDTLRKPNGEPYLSGTEWEYEDAVNSAQQPRPEVLVYRRTEEPKIGLRDPQKKEKEEQFERVEAFFAQLRSLKRGVNEYAAPGDFKVLLRQHLEEMLHRRLRPSGDDIESALTAPEIPAEYYDWLRRSLEKVELLGAKEGHAVTLNHVYVPALTLLGPRTIDEVRDFGAIPDVDEVGRRVSLFSRLDRESPYGRRIPLLQRLDQESLYVSAPAGAGKSTFCRWAVLQSIAGTDLTHALPAPEDFAEPVPANLRNRLPLLVPLREFWRSIDCGRGERSWKRSDLERSLAKWIDGSPPDGLTGSLLLAHLEAGTAFLLLDGLDEVPVSDARDSATVYPRDLLLSGLVDALPKWHKAGNRVLLTSRPYGLDKAGLHRLELPSAPLEPLPHPLRELFVARWFHALDKAEQTAGLIATIHERSDLAPLVENPLLLTALCVLYDSGGRLPEDRYQLYRRIVDNVLFHRFHDEVLEREPARARLEAIALGMHEGDAQSPRLSPEAEISRLDLERVLREFAAEDSSYERGRVEPVAQRENLLTRSGLLLPRPNDRAAFYHLSIQEFLAAERILRIQDDLLPVFRERGAVAGWRPTLMFLFAGKVAAKTPRWGADLLLRLIDQDRAAVRDNPAPAVFIAEALELCLAKRYAVPDALAERFRRLALDAIEDEIELPARQALGLCLGRVGDPRIFQLRDPRAYVEVPAGSYPYGDRGKTIEIATPFRIGRYPVTNSQYAEFIDGGSYRDRRWWSDAGWTWLQEENVTEPSCRRGRRWNAANQPVVGVSFWEAEACCAWAGGRLPSEQEWEAAARGPRGLAYPWGNDWEGGICNTSEAGLGVTSPVGLFPHARQAELGVEDLAGNVWEWCGSLYGWPSIKDSNAARMLRGGSWDDDQDLARSAARRFWGYPGGGDVPLRRISIIGFRVVCSSPIKGHSSLERNQQDQPC